MDKLDSFWEELKFEVGTIGINTLTSDEVLIGSGKKGAKIMFIADDPKLYQNEDLKVEPNSSGEFLIKLCDIEGITPESYYLTTLAKRNCKFNAYMPEEQEKLYEILKMQIAMAKPKIIVGLGGNVAELLLGRDVKIQDERGKVISWLGGIKLIFTYDVNFVKKSRNEMGKKSRVAIEFWNDLKFIKSELNKINE